MKVDVVSVSGNPMDDSIWSGTPASICNILKNRGVLGKTINSSPKAKLTKYLIKIISRILYNNSDEAIRGKIYRHINSYKVHKNFKNESRNILHMGTLDLPPHSSDNNKHYLYCDSTWDLWHENKTQVNYKSKLTKDAEKLEKYSYESCEHIFTISEYVKNNIISNYKISPNKITVVGTGRGEISPFFGEKNYNNGKILFVAKGRFEDKGGSLLVEGFKKAYQKNNNLELIIVGDENYKNLIDEHPSIKVYGYVSWDKLQSLFNECSLFALPAINEPWGLVYLEALSCKIPILGLNRNSFPEISKYGEYGFGIDEFDHKKVTDKILNAFSNPKKMKLMGQKGQKYCLDKFTWEKTVDKIIKEIRKR